MICIVSTGKSKCLCHALIVLINCIKKIYFRYEVLYFFGYRPELNWFDENVVAPAFRKLLFVFDDPSPVSVAIVVFGCIDRISVTNFSPNPSGVDD